MKFIKLLGIESASQALHERMSSSSRAEYGKVTSKALAGVETIRTSPSFEAQNIWQEAPNG